MGHSAHVTRVRWSYEDNKLISIGGGDTTVMIWEKFGNTLNESVSKTSSIVPSNSNKSKGESEESDTDSEYEGYDSDVKRENTIDYSKNMFTNPIKRPPPEILKTMYEEAKAIDKK